MEATLSGKAGMDFTAEFLRKDIGGQFGLKNLVGNPAKKSLISYF
jgi:hypothetical protein